MKLFVAILFTLYYEGVMAVFAFTDIVSEKDIVFYAVIGALAAAVGVLNAFHNLALEVVLIDVFGKSDRADELIVVKILGNLDGVISALYIRRNDSVRVEIPFDANTFRTYDKATGLYRIPRSLIFRLEYSN